MWSYLMESWNEEESFQYQCCAAYFCLLFFFLHVCVWFCFRLDVCLLVLGGVGRISKWLWWHLSIWLECWQLIRCFIHGRFFLHRLFGLIRTSFTSIECRQSTILIWTTCSVRIILRIDDHSWIVSSSQYIKQRWHSPKILIHSIPLSILQKTNGCIYSIDLLNII